MASLILHEIIGELYCDKNDISDRDNLLYGNIAPDTLPTDKEQNHYVSHTNYSTYFDAISGRVNLSAFCKEKAIITPYLAGYFLHLVTDYIFYERLIINNPNFARFIKEPYLQSASKMYKEYDRVAHFVCNKYPNIDISKLPDFATTILEEPLTLFTKSQLSAFIETCSNLDLKKIYSDILKDNFNTLNSINF